MAHIGLSIIFLSCLIGMAQYPCRCCGFSTLLYYLASVSLSCATRSFFVWIFELTINVKAIIWCAYRNEFFKWCCCWPPVCEVSFLFFFLNNRSVFFLLSLSLSHSLYLSSYWAYSHFFFLSHYLLIVCPIFKCGAFCYTHPLLESHSLHRYPYRVFPL